MCPSAVAWPRITLTSIINMMFGTFQSGWSKNSQIRPSKRVVRTWSHGIQSISITCNDSVQILREKWKSVLDHVSNKHKWTGNTYFHQCCHRRISSSEAKKVCWLKPGTQTHLAFEEVILNTKLLKDLTKLTDFCHTGKLEVYHSMMLKVLL